MGSRQVQRYQRYSRENANDGRDRSDGNRHDCENDCGVSRSDDCDGDSEKIDGGGNETARAAGDGQTWDSCNRDIERTWRKTDRMRRES